MKTTDKTSLRLKAHALKPVITIGQAGLTAAVVAETGLALTAHELIKVKIRADREQRKQISHGLCAQTGAELIQAIGQVAVLYRPNPGP